AGNFSVNANGALVVGSANTGRVLTPQITLPQDTMAVAISNAGIVSVQQAGNNTFNQVGQILLSRFINPEGMLKLGDNLYAETLASGSQQQGVPGQSGLGTLQQNTLELSNVEPVTELVDLITT